MPDLLDGQTAEVWGSGAKPYQLKNVGGVYSHSCPAWRNQSLAIDQRTCKHLRQYRGEAVELTRLGQTVTNTPAPTKNAVVAPPLLLAETFQHFAPVLRWDRAASESPFFLAERGLRVNQ